MKLITIPMIIGAILGAIAGAAAINSRGSVDFGSTSLEGMTGIYATAALLGLIGGVIGLILFLLIRALQTDAKIKDDN